MSVGSVSNDSVVKQAAQQQQKPRVEVAEKRLEPQAAASQKAEARPVGAPESGKGESVNVRA